MRLHPYDQSSTGSNLATGALTLTRQSCSAAATGPSTAASAALPSAEISHLVGARFRSGVASGPATALRRRSGRAPRASAAAKRRGCFVQEHPSGRRRVDAHALRPRHQVADLVSPRPEQLGACRDAPLAEGRARINTQAASTGRNRCSSAARGSAPTTRSISCPSRITTSNGIDCAPNLVASPGFASTSTFTTFRCPA